MKNLFLLFLSILGTTAFGQTPVIQWQKSLGGTGSEYAQVIRQTPDGGYVLAGYTNSNDGDVTNNHGNYDFWVVKLSSTGTIQWQKTYGGTADDQAFDLRLTSDGGYIVAGNTKSNDGDVTNNHTNMGSNSNDCWVIKLSSTGTLQWQKTYGGTGYDQAKGIRQTTDGGYIFTGTAESRDGDLANYQGKGDLWVVKLSSTGIIQWQKSLGGLLQEDGLSIQQTYDGGYVVAGSTSSSDGDVTGFHGLIDAWVVKLSSTGSLQWQKALGGTSSEVAFSIQQTLDSGYIIAGFTGSYDGDVTNNRGSSDFWTLKLSSTGALQWQKPIGGTFNEYGNSVELTSDSGYLMAGFSQRANGDITFNNGGSDYWVIKMKSNGTIQWQKSLGGTSLDNAFSAQPTPDGGCIVAGVTASNDGDVTGNHGGYEVWVAKLLVNPAGVANTILEEGLSIYPNPATNELNVQSDEVIQAALIVDINGKTVYTVKEATSTNLKINTTALPSGLYLLRLQTTKGVQTLKIPVQH